MSRKPHILLTDGAGLDAHADQANVVVISFSRREVAAGLVGDAVDRLMHLSDVASRVRRFEGALLFMFEGYDDDRREIAQIPECREFFQAVTSQWGFWFHFLGKNHEQSADQMGLAIALLTPIVQLPPQGGTERFLLEPYAVAQTVSRLFVGMNALHQLHSIPVDQTARISDQISRLINTIYNQDT